MLKKILLIGTLSLLSNAVLSAIIEVPHPSGNVIVKKTDDGEQKLYVDGRELASNTFISVNRMIPTPDGVSDVYLIELSLGGSGTTPSYAFLTMPNGKEPLLSKEFGVGLISSVINDGKTITVKFNAAYNRFDNSLIQAAQTVTYKKGVVTVK